MKLMFLKHGLFVVATMLAISLAFGSAMAQGLRNITFAQPSHSAINSFPVYVAIGQGYFAEEGLSVSVASVDGSASVIAALDAGEAHFGRPGPGPVLVARSKGVDVVFVYNFAARSNIGLMVPAQSPLMNVADLSGRTIGVGTPDGAEVTVTQSVMTSAGFVEGTDYMLATVGEGAAVGAELMGGRIAAYAGSARDAAAIAKSGVYLRDIMPEEFARLFGNGIVVGGQTINEEPELVRKFLRAFMRAHIFASDPANKEVVLAHLAAADPAESADPIFAETLFDAVLGRTLPLEGSRPWGYQPPGVWADWQVNLVASGDLPAPLDDLQATFTNEFVTELSASSN